MPYSVKGFFEINEDMIEVLLMLEVLFTQDSKVEDLFCGASSGSEPSLFFSNYLGTCIDKITSSINLKSAKGRHLYICQQSDTGTSKEEL